MLFAWEERRGRIAQRHAGLGELWLSPRLLTGVSAHKLGSAGFGLGAVHLQKEQGACRKHVSQDQLRVQLVG